MTRYFIAGNVWLLLFLALLIGRDGTNPVRFFGVGGYHSPFSYALMKLACLVLGVVFLILAGRKHE